MVTVAYLANEFPSPVEPYVADEIEELRKRGVKVVAGSVRCPRMENVVHDAPEIVLLPLRANLVVQASWLCITRWTSLAPLVARIVFAGSEGLGQRLRALAHTFLGACYAARLKGRSIRHIHVHHGYFGSWIAMTAARLLGVDFSMTLHGSDLLLHGTYLDVKLANCAFCLTVSEYNRNHILRHYPGIAPENVIVARLGVPVDEYLDPPVPKRESANQPFTILAVGRLHAVKDHAFLVRACAELRARYVAFQCFIAGDGPERSRIESLIREGGNLGECVKLLGHVTREDLSSWYDRADVVALTSRSEGIPLVLMEALARGKLVLAPAITGIPELVIAGESGFLYPPGSMRDFVAYLLLIQQQVLAERRSPHALAAKPLDCIRDAARCHVFHNFNRKINLESFANLFLQRISPHAESTPDENLVLQQIQLSVQRDRSIPV
jgi:colanic acid/amylovoran biosynthesis glycosyltransferase